MNYTSANTITARQMPWDVMGHQLAPTSATDLGQALTDAAMDYDVETWDVQATDPYTGRTLDATKSRAVVRPTPDGMRVVGMVGTRFTPIQNRDAFAVATDLVGGYGATITGLADFRHGGASIMALDLGRPINLTRPDGGTDTTNLNLLVKNAHDGSAALTFALTPIRMACTNVNALAIRNAHVAWKIAHTPNAQERVNLARQAILNAVGYTERYRDVAQDAMDTEMVDAEFAKMVAGLWKVDADATGKVADRKRETQAQVIDLYRTSPTLDGIRGTRWGGYNALTEWADHYRPVKGDAAVAHAEGQIDGPNVRAKATFAKMFALV